MRSCAELAPGTLRSIEQAVVGFSASVPDLPGCVAAASTREALLIEIRAATQFHLKGLASDGFVAPASSSSVEMVSV